MPRESKYAATPVAIFTKQIQLHKKRIWQAHFGGHTTADANEVTAIRDLLYRLGCDERQAEHYRPHPEDEAIVVHQKLFTEQQERHAHSQEDAAA